MELYSIVAIFFIIGAFGIFTINRKIAEAVERKQRWIKYAVYLVLVFAQMVLIEQELYVFFAVFVVFGGAFEIFLVAKTKKILTIGLLAYSIFAIFYMLFFSRFERNMQQFLFVIIITFDGYSQLSGQLLGKTKLFPKMSPGKTLEGLSGGVISVIITSLALSQILKIETVKALIFGLAVCIFAVAGDFLASYYKRLNGVKDFSKIIPGHGGVLDRFDSLIFATFAFYFFQNIDFSNAGYFLATVYVFVFLIVFGIAEFGFHTLKIKAELTRKFVHFSSGIVCLSFPFFLSNHWLVLLLCANFMLVLFISERFGYLQSIHAVGRKSYGSFLFPVSIYACFICFQHFGNPAYFYLPIVILSACDPVAALVGKRWPFGKFAVGNSHKTLMGSAAFFVSALIIIAMFSIFINQEKPSFNLFFYSFAFAVVTTIAEALSRNGTDNFSIPLAVIICLIVL